MPPTTEHEPESGHFDPELKEHLLRDLAVSEQQWRWERRVQSLLVSFALALLTVICLAIWASTLRPRIALEAYGDPRAGDGLSTSLRIVAREPRSGAILSPLRAEAWLEVEGSKPRAIDNVGVGPESVDVVALLDQGPIRNPSSIRVIVETLDGTDDVTVNLQPASQDSIKTGIDIIDVRRTLELRENAGQAVDAMPATPILKFENQTLQLLLYPESGNLVGVLGNDVWALALINDQPRAGVKLRADPPGWTLVTNALGMATLHLTPGRGGGAIDWMVLSQASAASVHLPTKISIKTPPQQILARPRRQVVAPGTELIIDVQSVRGRTLLSYEVYLGARLLGSSLLPVEGGTAQLRLPVPGQAPAILAVRLQSRPLGEDGVRDEVFVLIHTDPAPQAWSWLVGQLGEQLDKDPGLAVLRRQRPSDSPAAEQLIQVALSRAQIQQSQLPQLAETRTRNQARVDARRHTWQRLLFSLYWFLGLGALFLASAAVWVHHRRLRDRLLRLQIDEHIPMEDDLSLLQRRVVVELAAVIAGMVFGLVIVYLFISNLWWG